ncbi:serine hydrolase domain-containing protein [Sphingomicrobium sediminis]|uniref:Beta-lactamase family protein n=1 Tax=Sphingomicrobium sediminis TaxID=2950949 RepID=A0A9X2J1J5_9SPHN|nr:serine hydrolase domain-containing protein [Sphingomicrobium sediminis]MCM8557333.1 beta-lactamase family protein [Sphingomicrobium sediminis]
MTSKRLAFLTLLAASTAPIAMPAAAQDAIAPVAVEESAQVTPRGVAYVIPDDWTLEIVDGRYVFTLPEGDTVLNYLEIEGAEDGEAAIAAAWAIVDPDFALEPVQSAEQPANGGWDGALVKTYAFPPAEQRVAQAAALQKDGEWSVIIAKVFIPTASRRGSQLAEWNQGLKPTDYEEQSLVENEMAAMDAELFGEWTDFIVDAMDKLEVPGAAVAVIEDGVVKYQAGLGVKDLETGEPVDTDTLFMVGSNTKGMTTLLIGTMAEDGLVDYDAPVQQYMPDFRLGDEETSKEVLVKHLICACTGLPRNDYEWIFSQTEEQPASNTFAILSQTQPTTEFGELFQYNNIIASAAGYVAGAILHPEMEVGAAYDLAMEERVFGPLGMGNVHFAIDDVLADGNFAAPHGFNREGVAGREPLDPNRTLLPVRPAGALWASIEDFADYVRNEQTAGLDAAGNRIMPAEAVLARRAPQVKMGADSAYGMGVMMGDEGGLKTTFHGGSTFGYQSNYLVIPERNVAIIMLTNASHGTGLIAESFDRFFELAFDADEDAADDVDRSVERRKEDLPKFWEDLAIPPAAEAAAVLADRYSNDVLGELTVDRDGERVFFNLPTMRVELATKEEDDGSTSFVVIAPGFVRGLGYQLVDGTLVLRDAQHEYVYEPAK